MPGFALLRGFSRTVQSGFAQCEGMKRRKGVRCCFSGKYYFQACSVNLNRVVCHIKSVRSWKLQDAELCHLEQGCFVVTLDGQAKKTQFLRGSAKLSQNYKHGGDDFCVSGVRHGGLLGFRPVRVGHGELGAQTEG